MKKALHRLKKLNLAIKEDGNVADSDLALSDSESQD